MAHWRELGAHLVMADVYKCKICGAELSSEERLEKHKQIHKDQKWRDAGYVDPNNARYPTFAQPSNFVSNFTAWFLGRKKNKK